MKFNEELNKLLKDSPTLPSCYQFVQREAQQLVTQATEIPLQEHMARLEACKEKVNRREYAVGGQILHRGFFCPSPVQDIVIGNCNRGRMVKSLARTKRKIDYEYGLCDNRLLTVRWNMHNDLFEEEYLSYEANKQIGYTFDQNGELIAISVCKYQGELIQSYFYVHLLFGNVIHEARKEEYKYKEGKLSLATWHWLTSGSYCMHFDYIFDHDVEGYLSSYQVIEYDKNQAVRNSSGENNDYKVFLRRKI